MVTSFDGALQRFQDELYEARMTIISLMPEATQQLLNSYYQCESRDEAREWRYAVVDELIDSAVILPRRSSLDSSDRAYCPLCGQGSSAAYETGFAIPEGLRRHLIGWGNTQQCGVIKATLGLAADYWNSRFRAAEQAEEAEERNRLEARKRTETLYCTVPDEEPRLRDEGIGFGTLARDETQLAWAETRLAELGIHSTSDSNIKSYTCERGEFVVYADPRAIGRITFRVYKKPLPKRRRGPRVRRTRTSVFELMDGWKHDIQAKYEVRLRTAMERLD